MKSNLSLIAFGIALILIQVIVMAAENTTSNDVIDAHQESRIATTYALNPYLRANNLQVVVRNGKATLIGNVDDDVRKDLAEQIALCVDGIQQVDNQIKAQNDDVAPAPSAERSYGDIIDDATITAVVKLKLLWSKYAYTQGLMTEVNTISGKVTLQGTADTAKAKTLASSLAMNTHGVVSVDNQVIVDESWKDVNDILMSVEDASGWGVNDTWITTKVKSTFMYSSNVNSSAISVTTNNGIVTLTGFVSRAERDLAIKLARNVRGVMGVNSRNLEIRSEV